MLLAGETLLLRGGDNFTIRDKTSRAIMIKGGNSYYMRHSFSLFHQQNINDT